MYSFDVFDTLITRTTANPFGIFALMQNRMKEEKNKTGLDEYVIDNFYTLRIHSEELIRKSASFQQVEEVGLQDIYKAMSVNGCLSQSQIVYLCHLEEKIEIANTVGISENIQKVKELLKSGERVVLISDMYLSEKVIRKMLVQYLKRYLFMFRLNMACVRQQEICIERCRNWSRSVMRSGRI